MPATPSAWLVTPVLSRVIWPGVLATFESGVKVAVQVLPPSLVVRLVSAPLVAVRSARVKPLTA